MGEEREVSTAHLVGDDAESFVHDVSQEVGGEEAIVAAQQEACGDLGPPLEGPWILEEPACGLADVVGGRGSKLGGDVVEEQLVFVEGLR